MELVQQNFGFNKSNTARPPQLPSDWLAHLSEEFEMPYMLKLKAFLQKELTEGKIIYPHGKEIFTAFNLTPLNDVKIVIFGQDPYHGPGQAHGLSFSVKPGIRIPPSLINIYQEISSDLGIASPSHGHLKAWASQGVLLLNSVLTVETGKAGSHQQKGWEQFTDRVVQILNRECRNLVFLLWGSHAQKKGACVDLNKHKILKAPHPSPLSAHRGFFGCRHFSMANHYLTEVGKEPIDWSLEFIHS